MINTEKTIRDYNDVYFDFEVLPEYICVTFFQSKDKKWDTFEFAIDDLYLDKKLYAFKNWIQNVSENNIFIGWNVFYDKTILYHILEFIKNKQNVNNNFVIQDDELVKHNNQPFFDEIFKTSLSIVNDTYKGYPKFDKSFVFYDASKYRLPVSLKVVAGEMGLNIEESSVPWDKRNLTNLEKNELIKYNINDVDVLYRINQKYYEAYQIRKDLVEEFSPNYLPAVEFKNNFFFNKIFDMKNDNNFDKDENEEYANSSNEYYNFYNSVKDNQRYMDSINYFYKDKENLSPELKELYDLFFVKKINIPLDPAKFKDPRNIIKPKKGITFNYLGMETTFALGGIHGSKDGFITNKDAYMVDVASYYPNGMIKYHLQAKQVYQHNKENVLPEFLEKRLVFKHSDDPKLKAKDKPYKVLINAMYGVTRATFASIYDPIAGTNLCILGQFLLLALCEEIKDDIEDMIQINTDGIYYVPKAGHQEIIEKKVANWEKVTGFTMEYTKTTKTFNFNVNNYIIEVEENGKKKYKVKGRYINQVGTDILKKSSVSLTYDNHIIGRMIFDYFVNLQDFDTTISKHQELWKYASVKKITSNYDSLLEVDTYKTDIYRFLGNQIQGINLSPRSNPSLEMLHSKEIDTKVNRFFAVKNDGKKYKKFANKKKYTYQEFLDTFSSHPYNHPENYFSSDKTTFYQNYELVSDEQTNETSWVKLAKNKVYVFKDNYLFTFTKYASKDEYSFTYKHYIGEDFGYVAPDAKIYNLPLFKNYENKYEFEPQDVIKVNESNLDIDFQWYKNEATKLIGSYSKGIIYEKFVQNFPFLAIDNFYQLNNIKKPLEVKEIDDLYK